MSQELIANILTISFKAQKKTVGSNKLLEQKKPPYNLFKVLKASKTMSLMHIILQENGLNSVSTCNKYENFYYIQQLPNIKNYGV